MRKAGQVGLWLVLVASSWMPLSALAQGDLPPATPYRLESDPRLAAANRAWHDTWRANVEAHLRTVAARGAPRDLLAAGLLWPPEDDGGHISGRGSSTKTQASAWLQAAQDTNRDDALVDWVLLADGCGMARITCDRQALLERLLRSEGGNAQILLLAYHDAIERGDTAAAERYWQAASQAPRHDMLLGSLGSLLVRTLRDVPAPALGPDLAAALGDDMGLGRLATPRDMADSVAFAVNAAITLPSFAPLTRRCTSTVAKLPSETITSCRRIYTLLADDQSTLITSLIALPRLVEWAENDAARDMARERLRRFAWMYTSAFRLRQEPTVAGHMPEDHLDRVFRDGELAAMRHQLQLNGIPTEPPAGWVPDNPEWRALLTGKPVPANR
jgi:hypothetical protein